MISMFCPLPIDSIDKPEYVETDEEDTPYFLEDDQDDD